MEEKDEEIQLKTSGSSTMFTISFEDENENASAIKQKRIIKTANMFTRTHYRTLSLPVANNSFFPKNDTSDNGCESKNKESFINGKSKDHKFGSPQRKKNTTPISEDVKSKHYEDSPSISLQENSNCNASAPTSDMRSMDNGLSDTESEGGTYTIDRNNEQVKQARKSIDQVFGISSETENDLHTPTDNKFDKRTRMVDEWIEHSASILRTKSNEITKIFSAASKTENKARPTKIPFPIEKNRELGSNNSLNSINNKNSTSSVITNGNSQNSCALEPKKFDLVNDDEDDTEQYLKATENIVTTIEKRIHDDIKPLRLDGRNNVQNEKEITPSKYSVTRFNRAFSLRRDRLKKPSPIVTHTTIPVRSKTFIGTGSVKTTVIENSPKVNSNIKRNNSFCKDYVKSNHITPKSKPSPRLKSSSDGVVRKNNVKSSQEIELHNWKRRKNYDPLKAVAEEKKRKALAGTASNSTSSAHLKKECHSLDKKDEMCVNIITRSASFHGLRNRNGYERESPTETPVDRSASNRSVSSYFISSNDDDTADYDNDGEDHWVIPKPPSTSLQNTPPESISSRLSLLSNPASNSSVLLLSSSQNAKVDSTTVSKVTQMSYKIKDTILALTDSMNEHVEDSLPNCSLQFKEKDRVFYNKKNIEGDDSLHEESNNDEEEEEDVSFTENNDISIDYQLNIALNNLNEIYQAVQKLQFKCAK